MDQTSLEKMTPAELLTVFFDNYGKVTKNGFIVPQPMSHDTSAGCFSFRALQDSKDGQKLLNQTLLRFKKGDIDENGRPKRKR